MFSPYCRGPRSAESPGSCRQKKTPRAFFVKKGRGDEFHAVPPSFSRTHRPSQPPTRPLPVTRFDTSCPTESSGRQLGDQSCIRLPLPVHTFHRLSEANLAVSFSRHRLYAVKLFCYCPDYSNSKNESQQHTDEKSIKTRKNNQVPGPVWGIPSSRIFPRVQLFSGERPTKEGRFDGRPRFHYT